MQDYITIIYYPNIWTMCIQSVSVDRDGLVQRNVWSDSVSFIILYALSSQTCWLYGHALRVGRECLAIPKENTSFRRIIIFAEFYYCNICCVLFLKISLPALSTSLLTFPFYTHRSCSSQPPPHLLSSAPCLIVLGRRIIIF